MNVIIVIVADEHSPVPKVSLHVKPSITSQGGLIAKVKPSRMSVHVAGSLPVLPNETMGECTRLLQSLGKQLQQLLNNYRASDKPAAPLPDIGSLSHIPICFVLWLCH